MHVIKKKTLQAFWRRHPAAEIPLRAWLKDAQAAKWRTMHDIKAYARTADVNIGGNKFRLVVLCLLAKGRLYVRFVGTHAEYDRIDVIRI